METEGIPKGLETPQIPVCSVGSCVPVLFLCCTILKGWG